MPNRSGVTYQQKIHPQQNDYGVKPDLPKFDGRIDPDEFINWLQFIMRIFEFK